MISIIITPKFNKENILSINLKNQNKKIYRNIKICFSLVYSIKSLEGAIISRQVGRYYELHLKDKDLYSNKNKIINIKFCLRTFIYWPIKIIPIYCTTA